VYEIVAVTACAGEIAHSYMAVRRSRKAQKKVGDEAKVEIQAPWAGKSPKKI
jgi:fructose-specific phosphotransferase system component IIB